MAIFVKMCIGGMAVKSRPKAPCQLFFLVLLFLFFSIAVSAAGAKHNLDFKDTDLKDILRALASAEQVNMVIDPQIQGQATFYLHQVTFKEALETLAREYGFSYEQKGPVYYLTALPAYQIEITPDPDEQTLSVKLVNAPVVLILEELTELTGVNIVFPRDVGAVLTLTLQKVPFETLLKLIAENASLEIKKEPEFIRLNKKPISTENLRLVWEDQRLTLDAKNVGIRELARELTTATGVSVVTDQDLNANVTVFFQNLSLEEGLRVLCQANNLFFLKEGENLFRISRGEGGFSLKYQDGLLSITAKNIEVSKILDEVARQARVNILYDREVRGAVSITFDNLPLEAGLRALLENNGFFLEHRTGSYYVSRTALSSNSKIYYDPERQLFDLELVNASLPQVLSDLAKKAQQNIIIYNNVNHTVNQLSVKEVTLEEAFQFLLMGTPYTYLLKDNVYLFGDGRNLRPESSDLIAAELYRLQYTNVEYIFNNLPPHLPRSNIIPFNEQNALLVSGSREVQAQIKEFLALCDRPENQLRTELIRLKNIKAEEALKLLPSTLPRNDVMVIKEANAIAVTGTGTRIQQITAYLEKIDIANPLILFDIMVVQLNHTSGKKFGLAKAEKAAAGDVTNFVWDSMKSLFGQVIIPGSDAANNVKLWLEAMVNEGEAKLAANPQITTLNGHNASFNVTSRYPRTVLIKTTNASGGTETTETKLVEVVTGIQVTLTPWVSANKDITIEIKPKITQSVPDTLVGSDQSQIPATSERSTESTVRVRNGDPVIIGGLIQTQESVSKSKIPILGSIPLIGSLFSNTSINKEETEFVIVITPYLLSGEYADREEENQAKPVLERYEKYLSPPALQTK